MGLYRIREHHGREPCVGRSGNSEGYTDGQLHGIPHTQDEILAFDVSVVEPNSTSHTNLRLAASIILSMTIEDLNSSLSLTSRTFSSSRREYLHVISMCVTLLFMLTMSNAAHRPSDLGRRPSAGSEDVVEIAMER